MAHIAVYRSFSIDHMGSLVGGYGQVWGDRRVIAECWGPRAPHGLTLEAQTLRQRLCEKHLQEDSVPLAGGDYGSYALDRVPRCRCGIYGTWTTDDLVLRYMSFGTVVTRCVLFGVVDLWTEMAKASGAIIEEMWCHVAVKAWLEDRFPGVTIHGVTNLETLQLPDLTPILDGVELIARKPIRTPTRKPRKHQCRHLRTDGRVWLTLKHIFADGKPHKTAEVIQYWEDHADDYKKVGLCGGCFQMMMKQRKILPYGSIAPTCDHKRAKGSGMRDLMQNLTHALIARSFDSKLRGTGWHRITPFGKRVLRNDGHYVDRRRW